jgi:transcriptional regulator with XRE-family HTH domain
MQRQRNAVGGRSITAASAATFTQFRWQKRPKYFNNLSISPQIFPDMLAQSFKSCFGANLRDARRKAGFSKTALSEKTGLSAPTLRLLEKGRGNLVSLQKVLSTLGAIIEGGNIPTGKSEGERLVALRKRHGFSQCEFAERLGVSQATLVRLEKRGCGRVKTLERALALLGTGAKIVLASERGSFFETAGNSSAFHGWETPKWIMEALQGAVGRFDLDPCAPSHNTRKGTVRARVRFIAQDDGLKQSWVGRVFVNPPYRRTTLKYWIHKARTEVENGNASLVVGLLPMRPDTGWFHADVAGHARVLGLKGRLKFGDGKQSAPFPSMLALWGGTPEQITAIQDAFPDAWRA